jgi:hypothetical protein
LFHYYFTTKLFIFAIISDYFRVLHPYFQELADANTRPKRRAMTDKCTGVQTKIWVTRQAHLMMQSPHIQLREHYYTHYIILIVCPGFGSL